MPSVPAHPCRQISLVMSKPKQELYKRLASQVLLTNELGVPLKTSIIGQRGPNSRKPPAT